jgi:carboxylesterase
MLWPLLGTIVVLVTVRSAVKWRFERRATRGRRFDADGIIVGAEPLDLTPPGRPIGAALLLHGFGDTPQTLHYLAADLAAAGWVVRVPLLPGHGRTLAEFARTRATDWIVAAREELGAMRASAGAGERLVIVGLSMGGALATILAAETPDLAAMALVSPYLGMPLSLRIFAKMWPLAAIVAPYVAGGGARSIRDASESADNLAYRSAPPALVAELGMVVRAARGALGAVRVPTVVVASHHDNRVPPAVIEWAYGRLAASTKRLVWEDAGAHVLTVDYGRDAVSAVVAEWLRDAG